MSAVSGGECDTSRSLCRSKILYGVLCRGGSGRNGAKPLEGFTYQVEGPTELDLKLIVILIPLEMPYLVGDRTIGSPKKYEVDLIFV